MSSSKLPLYWSSEFEQSATGLRRGGDKHCDHKMAVMDDRGFFLTLQAIRRRLAAMPNELYLVRLIHSQTRKALPGERLWTAEQLGSAATVRFGASATAKDATSMCSLMPAIKTQATFSSTWIAPNRR